MNANYTGAQSDISDYPSFLIEKCRKGDHKAMLQVYKMFYKPVFRWCLLLAGDPAKAENLMQESFLRAFENIGSFNGNTPFIEWLITNIN